MTAPDATAIVCPSCDATTFAELSDGTVICLVCRTEWDPNDPPVRARDPLPATWVTADAVLGPPPGVLGYGDTVLAWALDDGPDNDTPERNDDDASRVIVGNIPHRLMLEGGQVVTVVEFVDEDWVRVRMNDDREEVVNFADVVRSLPTVPDVVQAVDDIPDDAMRIITALGGLLHAVAVVTRACNVSPAIVTNILATYNDFEAPVDVDLLPIVLGDTVAALQMLADAFGLPPGIVKDFASVEPTNANTAESEKTE